MQIFARKGVNFYQNWTINLMVEPARLPAELIVPLSVIKGEALELAVQPGTDLVKNQPLAQPQGDGSPVYAPCAGRFAEIVERRLPGLGKTPCARILVGEEGTREASPAPQPPTRRTGRYSLEGGARIEERKGASSLNLRRLIEVAKRAAIVDEIDGQRLWKKLAALEGQRKPAAVYAYGVDDQPYMAAALGTLASFGREVVGGLNLLGQALSASTGILCRQSREAAALLAEDYMGVPVVYISGKYPSLPAAEAYLEVVRGMRFGVGACMHLCRAAEEGVPQTTSILTVAGDGVQTPLNLEVPLGVSVGDLLEQCGAFGVIQRVAAGGIMTGRIAGPQSPLHPGITALTAQSEVFQPPKSACVGCGRCAAACPAGLAPFRLYQAARKNVPAQMEALGGKNCMGCGCCSYVCPAGLPLTSCAQWVRRRLEESGKKAKTGRKPPKAPKRPAKEPAVTAAGRKEDKGHDENR
ncbi:MAG: 4Fe-4S dicluster domain-containing protein [Clostridiales bacterium]|nr:4Fe-4S dicluster domain-containing protein [Clostridiales bacterium]